MKDLFGHEDHNDPGIGTPYVMREPCQFCLMNGREVLGGFAKETNGQNVIRCALCKRQCYNAPKAETGTPQRNVKSRPDLKDGQRERILLKCGGRCFICGRAGSDGAILHVAHALSVAENKKLEHPAPEELLGDDINLFAACEECNLGMSWRSLAPEIMVRLLLAAISRNGEP